jgi:hypothetical protein
MSDHVKLFIPGPVEVRREILDAQAQWMIGHRGKPFEALFARIQAKLRRADTPAAQRTCAILDIILHDEVGHVAIGNRWYHWLCDQYSPCQLWGHALYYLEVEAD